MPFTLAHPAIRLPLAPAATRFGVPFAALAAGSMAPDVPLFVPAIGGYALTHTPVGIVTVDVAVGMAVWLGWVLLLRAPATDAMPDRVRRRLPVPPRWRHELAPTRVLLAVGAVVVGAASHVDWDEFTHAGRWGSRHIAWLAQQHGPLLGTSWAQYASGVGGLLALGVAAVMTWRRSSTRHHPSRRRLAPAVVAVPLLASGVVASAVVATGVAQGWSVHAMAYLVATRGIAAGAIAALLAAAAWHLAPEPVLPAEPVVPVEPVVAPTPSQAGSFGPPVADRPPSPGRVGLR